MIDFEDLTTTAVGHAGQIVDRQYETRGVVFNSPWAFDYTELGAPGFPHRGSNAIEHCFFEESCTTSFKIQFTRPQARIKLWVGFSRALNQTQVVVLRAFDQSGALVGSTQITLPASQTGHPIRTPLEVSLDQPGIMSADVGFAAGDASTAGLAVDDLEFVAQAGTLSDPEPEEVLDHTGPSLIPSEPLETDFEQGPQLATAPGLQGLTQAQAQESLAYHGLRLGRVERDSVAGIGEQTVVSQEPGRGTPVPPNSPIDVVLAFPGGSDETRTIAAPDVTGQTVEEARRRLDSWGLQLALASGHSWEDSIRQRIAGQDPPAGTVIAVGSTILVTPLRPDGVPWILILGTAVALSLAGFAVRAQQKRRRENRRPVARVRVGITTSPLSTTVKGREGSRETEIRLRLRRSDIGLRISSAAEEKIVRVLRSSFASEPRRGQE